MNLDKIVFIERRGEAQDAAGQRLETWRRMADAEQWASIRPLSGREPTAASGPRSEITHEIILRYGATVAPRDRLSFGGRKFDIKSVINTGEQNRYLKLSSVENVD